MVLCRNAVTQHTIVTFSLESLIKSQPCSRDPKPAPRQHISKPSVGFVCTKGSFYYTVLGISGWRREMLLFSLQCFIFFFEVEEIVQADTRI